ncbi:purple acid phosphatase family protein [candidate division CSSED10-310 bacterium]|uniref:Purple acid phosphatase family protein n=1 Tax=candidate division CSSED10-310 bacterium TaxID=2855610 RepID=A0ABV6YR74_UNCC1
MLKLLLISVLSLSLGLKAEEESHFTRYQEYLRQLIQPQVQESENTELSADPEFIHLSWQQSTSTAVTITWLTASGDNKNGVRYGKTTSYEIGTVLGSSKQSPFSGYIHEVQILMLEPETTYHYSCSPDTGGSWSQDSTFTTGPATKQAFSFTACGDSRQWFTWPLGNLNGWNTLITQMIQYEFAFCLFTGDMTYDGDTEEYWYDWFDKAEPLTRNVPLMPAIGNHETTNDENAEHYQGMFTLPEAAGTERWYSFDYSAAHFIVLDSENIGNEQQLNWLQADLAQAADQASWIIVSLHRPPYCSGSGPGYHAPDSAVQQNWVPLFDQYHVDLVFLGHNHFYQRTFPLYGGNDPSQPLVTDFHADTYHNPEGSVYVVCGAAGAPTLGYIPDNDTGYIAFSEAGRDHFCLITISEDDVLHCATYDKFGVFLDQFWIHKSLPVPTIRVSWLIILISVMSLMLTRLSRKPSKEIERG